MSLNPDQKNRDSCCKARAKSGEPCRAAATSGGLCFFHANPNKAAELGRIGGRKKSRLPAGVVDPLPSLDKASAVRDAVEKLVADVYAGRLHPRVTAGLAPLLSLQLRAVEATDLESRIDTIEKLLAKAAEAERKRTRDSASRLGKI